MTAKNFFITQLFVIAKITIFLLLFFNYVQAQNSTTKIANPYFIPALQNIENCWQANAINNFHYFIPNQSFNSSVFFLSAYYYKKGIGLNLGINNFFQTGKIFKSTTLSLSFAKDIPLNKKEKLIFYLRPKYKFWNINESQLIFSSMIDQWEGIIYPLTEDIIFEKKSIVLFDFGLVWSKKSDYLGFGIRDLSGIKDLSSISADFYWQKKYSDRFHRHFYKTFLYASVNNFSVEFIEQFFYYVKELQFGFGFTEKISGSFVLGINPQIIYDNKKISVFYSFEYFPVKLKKNFCCSHQIGIKLRFNCEKNQKSTIKCPAYQL